MAERFFDDDRLADDDDVLEFLAALNAGVSVRPLPVPPDDVWVQWWGTCLYIAVAVPALRDFSGCRWVAGDLEVGFWPQSAHRGRALEGGWGDSGRPFDSVAELRVGRLDVRDARMSPSAYAAIALSWLHEQSERPLDLCRWTNSSACRVVLSDSGDIVATRGRQWWRRPPDTTERLSSSSGP